METPSPSPFTRVQIADYAHRVYEWAREREIVGPSGKLDVKVLVGLLGGKIAEYGDQAEMAWRNSIAIEGQNKFTIVLDSFASEARNRFTLAHELGHYFVHSKQGKTPMTVQRMGSGPVEVEANYFAASLLMPADEFTKTWEALKGNCYAVADAFEVSSTAAYIRASVLGLV